MLGVILLCTRILYLFWFLWVTKKMILKVLYKPIPYMKSKWNCYQCSSKNKDIGWLYYVTWEAIPIIDDSLRKDDCTAYKASVHTLFLVDIQLLVIKKFWNGHLLTYASSYQTILHLLYNKLGKLKLLSWNILKLGHQSSYLSL